ncbi:putative nuclease HARBI1 [Centruroides sculpturatus]|uniref:putative nuclease HARBI1 n=1 Tax=Centruroides sculpturatus TaxID=218467 RepID=UPI000C6E0F1B|nr:putative nuclease HARBI1 [Centruroides sculpturatus]
MTNVDRGRAVPRNVLTVVTSINPSGLYQLGNKESLLDRFYARSELTNSTVTLLTFRTHLQLYYHFAQHPSEHLEKLLEFVQDNLQTSETDGIGKNLTTIPVIKKILITVWYLANQESYRQIADRFRVWKSTAHYIISATIKAIASHQHDFIQWPESHQYKSIANDFESKRHFPGVIGAIDGTYIHCKPPMNGRNAFVNCKGDPLIILQAICNSNKVFLDIFADRAGSTRDARVFHTSPLGQRLANDPNFIPSDYHLLGDSAYPCTVNLLTPFRDNGHLSPQEKHYNYVHSSTRVVIEQAFGILKAKFRRLKYIDKTRIDLVPNVVIACCCLHNLILNTDGSICECDIEEEEDDDDDDDDKDKSYQIMNDDSVSGKSKRNEIMRLII